MAERHGARSVAFPAISTGVYSYPLEPATNIAVAETKQFLERNETMKRVIFMYHGSRAYDVYLGVLTTSGA